MALYSNPCPCCSNIPFEHALMISQNRWEQIIEKVFKGTLNTGDIPEDLLSHYGSVFRGAIDDGRTSELSGIEFWKNDILMKRNGYDFAASKSYNLINELSIIRDKGGFKTLDEFKQFVDDRGIFNLYNKAWLDSEAQQFLASSQMSTKWIEMQQNIDVAPNLRYNTVGDDRVRPSHAELDGLTKPKNDRFWDTYYPPNDWGCRCDVDETDASPSKKKTPKVEINDLFKNNPGKTGISVTNKHPYFKLLFSNNHSVYKSVSKVMGELDTMEVYQKGKGSISIHPLQLESELDGNLSTAKVLADNNIKVTLPKYVETGSRNPDAIINKKTAEFKVPDKFSKKSIQSALSSANTQGANIAVINFGSLEVDTQEIGRSVKGALGKNGVENKNIKEVWLIYDGKLTKLTRKEILNDKFWGLL